MRDASWLYLPAREFAVQLFGVCRVGSHLSCGVSFRHIQYVTELGTFIDEMLQCQRQLIVIAILTDNSDPNSFLLR